MTGLGDNEIAVLRLLAEGMRPNRSHAVAMAIRYGLI